MDQKTSFTKSFPFDLRIPKQVLNTGNGIMQTGNGIVQTGNGIIQTGNGIIQTGNWIISTTSWPSILKLLLQNASDFYQRV